MWEGFKKLAFIPFLVGMQTGTTFLPGDLEIFNKSLWKDAHPLCQTCFTPCKSTLHPSLPYPGPGRVAQWITSTGHALLPDLTPRQRWVWENDRDPGRSWEEREVGYLFSWFLPCQATCSPPLSVLSSFPPFVSLGIGHWLLCCRWLWIPLQIHWSINKPSLDYLSLFVSSASGWDANWHTFRSCNFILEIYLRKQSEKYKNIRRYL